MDKQDLSGNSVCCLFVKILKYFEECTFHFVNLLTSLFTVFSVVVKANLYLGFLYLIKKTAVQINLCMKLQWRSWFENRVCCAWVANSLLSKRKPTILSFLALYKLPCTDRIRSNAMNVGLARWFLPLTCQLLK